MPFKSEKQRKFMHWKHPEIAKRWDKEIKKELPEYAPMDEKGRYPRKKHEEQYKHIKNKAK